MKLIHAQRLVKLANYLSKMKNKNWDYRSVFNRYEQRKDGCTVKSCGSKGCAIGHAPMVFSNSCQYKEYDDFEDLGPNNSNYVVSFEIVGKGNYKGMDQADFATKFFGLTDEEADQLFWCVHSYGGENIRLGTSKKEIIQSIIELVKSYGFKIARINGQRVAYKPHKAKVKVLFVQKS